MCNLDIVGVSRQATDSDMRCMKGNDLQMVGGAFSGSFEVVVESLGGRVACLMNTRYFEAFYRGRYAKLSKPYIKVNTA